MNTYPANQIQSLAIDTWDGTEQLVNIFAANAGVSYPILMNGGQAGILTDYACNYDYFFVIGGDGLIKWRGDWFDPGMQAALDGAIAALTPSPVGDVPTNANHLLANYPNPFNPQTAIPYDLGTGPETAAVRLEIVDLRGRLVKTLVRERQAGGQHYEVIWNGTDEAGNTVPSGSYLARLVVDGVAEVQGLTLLK